MVDWLKRNWASFLTAKLFKYGIIAFLLLLTACDETTGAPQLFSCGYEVDESFKEFYGSLGGLSILDCPISALFLEGSNSVQYFQTVKLVNSPAEGIYLAPLGIELGYDELGVAPPSDAETLYLNEHIVFNDFVALYKQLRGFSGLPISNPRYNDELKQVEQYFENMGFAQRYGSSEVHLLPLGSIHCQANGEAAMKCEQRGTGGSIADSPIQIDPVFVDFVNTYGEDFTGAPVGHVEVRDGLRIQVFKHLVLAANPAVLPVTVQTLPISDPLNLKPDPARPPSNEPDDTFFSVGGELGYDIPDYFWNYISAHGGLQISGPPIRHLSIISPQLHKQCFANLCLNYNPTLPEGQRVFLENLGEAYFSLHIQVTPTAWTAPTFEPQPDNPPQPLLETTPLAPPADTLPVAPMPDGALSLQIWEALPTVRSDQSQEIEILITQNGLPVAGQTPTLIVEMPGESVLQLVFAPTNADGRSKLALPPIAGANSEIIPYRVCLSAAGGAPVCLQDKFIIWNLTQ